MLVRRRRQWASISLVLGQRLVFDGLHDKKRWTEMIGTHRLTERDRNTEQTEGNQHVPTSVCKWET